MSMEDCKYCIRSKENELFERWQKAKNYERFAKDGIIDHKRWAFEKYKILFVLKEVNSEKESFDLRDFLRFGGSSTYWRTWNNIARWTKAILEGGDYLKEVSKDEKIKWLSRIAAMNLKKVGGKSKAKDSEIRKYTINDAKEIREQIELYNPDIIICCGRGEGKNADLLHDYVFKSDDNEAKDNPWQPKIGEYNYFYVQLHGNDKRIPVMSFYHPQMRGSHELFEQRFNEMKSIAKTLREGAQK